MNEPKKPRISCLDQRFKYRKSEHTDIRETFRRARRRAALTASLEARKAKPDEKPTADVVQLRKHGGA